MLPPLFALCACGAGSGDFAPGARPAGPAPDGMVWIPGGETTLGTDDAESWDVERPAHSVRLRGFWLDETEVTNAQFARFVKETGHVTSAEKAVDWEEVARQLPSGTPKPADERLQPGSGVFAPPAAGPVEEGAWWAWTAGASWRHPRGPQSGLEGLDDHPVVHVAYDDALAYARWAGKRLPTEAEWEHAARGGLVRARFVWGDEPYDEVHPQCNAWQGEFPFANTVADGHERSSPVRAFPPNGFGLHGMAGNVWEWCADAWDPDAWSKQAAAGVVVAPVADDPAAVERVLRGGSFLCHPSYCSSYRPSARRGLARDTSLEHVGFRCARDP